MKIIFQCLMLLALKCAFIPATYSQKSSKKSGNDFVVVYQSGNTESGYGYIVTERTNHSDSYEYRIFEGNMVNGKRTGFGKTLYFASPDGRRIQFENRQSDSAKATDEINLLPKFYLHPGQDDQYITLKNYAYYIGLFKEDHIIKGTHFNTNTEVKFTGLFNEKAGFDYGTYDKMYRDTLVRGFLCMKELDDYDISCNGTGLRYFIADTSFRMVAYYDKKPVHDLFTYPMSDYHHNRKPVYNMPFKDGLYTGEAHNGKPEGLGEWISNDGEYVEYGYFKNGLPHGLFCKNFHTWYDNLEDKWYIDNPIKRPAKGIAVGVYTNGKPGKMYVDYRGTLYKGDVDENLLPNGYGIKQITSGGITESGRFVSGKLDGYGFRTDMDKNTKSGTFSMGTFVKGTYDRSVYGLQKFEVVKVNGKRLMVVDKKGNGEEGTYAILSNRTILRKGDLFEMSPGDNSEFVQSCPGCLGTGYVSKTSTYQVWTGTETSTSKKFERIGSNDYVYTTTEVKPIYTQQSTTHSYHCKACDGTGKLIKMQ
jgi:hypothetical protein